MAGMSAFQAREAEKGIDGLVVPHGDIGGPARTAEKAVLGSDTGVVEAGAME
jgi:hypothetical protein